MCLLLVYRSLQRVLRSQLETMKSMWKKKKKLSLHFYDYYVISNDFDVIVIIYVIIYQM